MSRRAWLLFATISLVWGVPYLLIKIAVAELDPAVIVFARVLLAALVLLPVAVWTGALTGASAHWRPLLALAVIEVVLPFLLIAYGEQHITSSMAGLLIAADPLFIAILALRFDASERMDAAHAVGLVVGLLGVAVLLGFDPSGDALAPLGGAMVLAAAVSYAGGALLIKRTSSSTPPLGISAVSLALASAMLAPIGLSRLPAQLPSLPVVASVLALSVVCTALGFIIYFSLIATAGAARAALITYVNPAVAVLLGVLVLNERLTPATLAGFALILGGCWLSAGGALRGQGALDRSPTASAGPAERTTASQTDLASGEHRLVDLPPVR